jgi:hypothetical protein
VNRHQMTAIDRHCRLSIEAMRLEFDRALPGGLAARLTVNSGYE